ncbi:TPA: hypothetical protein H1016_03420, partial [archaeon]|nr:hypothetical protein [Candidatus Naiadarchaeum limnaeum]
QKKETIIVKRKGHREIFDERKVYGSVYAACASMHYPERHCEVTAAHVTRLIKKWAKPKRTISSVAIRKKVASELKKKDKELEFFYEYHLPNLKKL